MSDSLYPKHGNSPDTEFRHDRVRYWLARAHLTEAGFDLSSYPLIDDMLAWRLWNRRDALRKLTLNIQAGSTSEAP